MSFVLIFQRNILREVMHNNYAKPENMQWFLASKVIYSSESLVNFKSISYFMDIYKLVVWIRGIESRPHKFKLFSNHFCE